MLIFFVAAFNGFAHLLAFVINVFTVPEELRYPADVIAYWNNGVEYFAELGIVTPELLVTVFGISSLLVFMFVQTGLLITLLRHKILAVLIFAAALMAVHAGALLL